MVGVKGSGGMAFLIGARVQHIATIRCRRVVANALAIVTDGQ